jgi:hypothetical protein
MFTSPKKEKDRTEGIDVDQSEERSIAVGDFQPFQEFPKRTKKKGGGEGG